MRSLPATAVGWAILLYGVAGPTNGVFSIVVWLAAALAGRPRADLP